MKLVSYRWRHETGVGALDPDTGVIRQVLDPERRPARSMRDLVDRNVAAGQPDLQVDDSQTLDLTDVELIAPLPDPARNIMCIGKNYHEHSAEFARSGYDAGVSDEAPPPHPIVFTKPATTVIGPGQPIEPHAGVTEALDYEAEVAVVIGRGGRGISSTDAWNHVWGYLLLNDVTARDLQRRHQQWFLGKSLDTFCPMGPWLVTADEIDGTAIEIECHVNGELRQRATTADLIFDIPTLVSTLSAGMELRPGDVLATGTPAGVGIGFDPPRFLHPGDKIAIVSPQLGRLENVVGEGGDTRPIVTKEIPA